MVLPNIIFVYLKFNWEGFLFWLTPLLTNIAILDLVHLAPRTHVTCPYPRWRSTTLPEQLQETWPRKPYCLHKGHNSHEYTRIDHNFKKQHLWWSCISVMHQKRVCEFFFTHFKQTTLNKFFSENLTLAFCYNSMLGYCLVCHNMALN